MADTKYFKLQIICPNRIFFEGDASMIEMNTTQGYVGVYARHVPTTWILQPGVVTITTEDGVRSAAVHEGFVEVLKDKVTVMAEVAEWPEEIDVPRAQAAKARAQERIRHADDKNLDVLRAELALKRAVTRLSLKK